MINKIIAVFAVVLMIVAFNFSTVEAKHACPDTGHGSDPSGGHGNGHGDGDDGDDGDGDGDSGTSGGNVGTGGADVGGDVDVDRNMMSFPKCSFMNWLNDSCPE